MTDYEYDDYAEVMEQTLSTMDKYLDYMSNQPMRDGEEIRDFFDSMRKEN